MPTEPYRRTPVNGQVWSSSFKGKTNLWSMCAITLDWLLQEVCMVWSPTPVQTFSEAMALAHWQSGSMTTFSSESRVMIWLVTTHSTQSGERRSKPKGAAGKRVAGYGTEERSFQAVNPRSSMKTVPRLSRIWLMCHPNQLETNHSRTPTETSTKYPSVLAYTGNPPKQSLLAQKCHIWASIGICTIGWYTCVKRRRPNIWWQSQSRNRGRNTIPSRFKNYTENCCTELVIPAGQAHLTSLEAMLTICSNSPFIPCSPPWDTPDNLEWWKAQLRKPIISKAISEPQLLVDYKAFSDASSGFGIAITVGPRWQAWRLAAGWKTQGQDIQWAKAVGLELLVIGLHAISKEGEHIKVYRDNWGVIEGWWKGSSGNKPTNKVFHWIIQLSEDSCRTIHTRYVPSEQNPADTPRGADTLQQSFYSQLSFFFGKCSVVPIYYLNNT